MKEATTLLAKIVLYTHVDILDVENTPHFGRQTLIGIDERTRHQGLKTFLKAIKGPKVNIDPKDQVSGVHLPFI